MNWKWILVLPQFFSSLVTASEQELYYNLHQAYTALEDMASGAGCENGRAIAKKYLIQGDRELGKLILSNTSTEFEGSLKKLWSTVKMKNLRAYDVELIRAEVQPLADKKALIHKRVLWHSEISSLCRKG